MKNCVKGCNIRKAGSHCPREGPCCHDSETEALTSSLHHGSSLNFEINDMERTWNLLLSAE